MPTVEDRKPSFIDSLTIVLAILMLCLSASAFGLTRKPPPQSMQRIVSVQADAIHQ